MDEALCGSTEALAWQPTRPPAINASNDNDKIKRFIRFSLPNWAC